MVSPDRCPLSRPARHGFRLSLSILPALTALFFAVTACSVLWEEDREHSDIVTPDFSGPQPGIDDPGARMWRYADDYYPLDPATLYRSIVGRLSDQGITDRRPARGVITPHANLYYSGAVQAQVFAAITVPDVVIVMAPDHYFKGEPLAVWGLGPWLIPGYRVTSRTDLAARLQEWIPDFVEDTEPFDGHPAEMQVLWLPYLNPDAEVVVLSFNDNSANDFTDFTLERINRTGQLLAGFITELENSGEEVLLLNTTDLVHYQPLDTAREQDAVLAALIADLDVEGLYTYVMEDGISTCGEIPTAIAMAALRELGHSSMEIVAESDSYEGNGNGDSVTGYLGGITWR